MSVSGAIAVVLLVGMLAVGFLGAAGLMLVDRYWHQFRADH